MKLVGHPTTGLFNRCIYQFEVFPCFLAMAEVACWWKLARWIQLLECVTDYKCGISISSIFETVFRYLPVFLAILRYWVPPMSPSFRGELKSRDLQVLIRKPKCTCQFKGDSVNHLFCKVILIINSFK